MKAISYLNLLTAVVIFLTGGFVWGQAAGIETDLKNSKTKEACNAILDAYRNFPDCKALEDQLNEMRKKGEKATETQAKQAELTSCLGDERAKKKSICEEKESKSDTTATCKASYDDWKKVVDDGADACRQFSFKSSKSNKLSCKEKVDACKKEIAEVAKVVAPDSTGSSGDDRGRIVDIVKVLAQSQGYTPTTGSLTPGVGIAGQTSTANCISFDNDKTDKKNDKVKKELDKIDDEIKKLKEKIADKKKKINEEDEKLRKENNEIDKDIADAEKEHQENLIGLDKKAQDELSSMHKRTQDSAEQLRTLNNVIIKRKTDLERLKYEQHENMLQFAEGKVKERCEQAIQIARDCFQKAARGEKFGEKDQCAGFSGPGRGLRGTANLNKRLKQVETACFEQADLASRKAKFNYSQQVAEMERDITTKMAKAKDDTAAAIRAREEYEQRVVTQKQERQNQVTATDTKKSNLKKKLADVQKTIEESKTLMDTEIKEHEIQIQELIARKLPGALGIVPNSNGDDVKVMHKEASAAIAKEEKARSAALSSCKCEESENTSTKSYCVPLQSTSKSVESGYNGSETKK